MSSSLTTVRSCPAVTAPGRSRRTEATVDTDDGGFEPDLAFPAIEHDFHGIAQLVAHVLRPGRAQAPVLVRRRRGDAAAERGEQLLRHRMRGHADGHRVLPAGDDVVHVRAALHHHRERTRPELLGELRRDLRHFRHPAVQEARRIEMHDDRMGLRPPFGFENLGDRRRGSARWRPARRRFQWGNATSSPSRKACTAVSISTCVARTMRTICGRHSSKARIRLRNPFR